jgi:hypothetical protein
MNYGFAKSIKQPPITTNQTYEVDEMNALLKLRKTISGLFMHLIGKLKR